MADEKKKQSTAAPKSEAKKAAKKDAPKQKVSIWQRMGNFFKRMWKRICKFFKDVKGECKKIVWPDAKTVLKSTWVVIVIVALVCLVLWLVDTGLGAGIKALINLAKSVGEKNAAQAGMMLSGWLGM